MTNPGMYSTAVDAPIAARERELPVAPPVRFSGPVDLLQLVAEWSARQIYWRSPWLRAWIKRARSRTAPVAQHVSPSALQSYLQSIGVTEGALVMAHTSVSGLSFEANVANPGITQNSLKVAQELVTLLQNQIGPSGTLVMPTHPIYRNRASQQSEDSSPPVYNPRSTPCSVGLANEVFWRQPGTLRSLFPHNTLAARGPLAEGLLHNNLHDSKPLPHGRDSGYYRFCQRNGLLISIGVPLASCFTLVHTAEEICDGNWPVSDFFEERRYLIREQHNDRPVTIRKTRTEFMKFSFCLRKLRRDLVRAGILHEGSVGTVRVDWAESAEVIRFIAARNQSSTYPYFGTFLVPRQPRKEHCDGPHVFS